MTRHQAPSAGLDCGSRTTLAQTLLIAALLSLPTATPAAEQTVINPFPRPTLTERTLVEWKFDQSVDGWTAGGTCQIAAADGCLRATSTGIDPMLFSPRLAEGDGLVLVLRMRTTAKGPAQIFWTGEGQPNPDEGASVRFHIDSDGQWHEYRAAIPADGVYRFRLDPVISSGVVDIDWMRIEQRQLHPLEIRRVQVAADRIDVWLRNHGRTALTVTFGAQTVQVAAKSEQTLSAPRTPAAGRAFETLSVRVESPGLPAVSRPVVAVNDAASLAWVEIQDGATVVQVAPDGSGGRLLRQGKLLATIAPLAWRDGAIPPFSVKRTEKTIRCTGPGGESLELELAGAELHYRLRATEPMEGPVVRATGGLEQGLLAGVEHLGRGETSSSDLDIRRPEHLRFAPDPMLLTMPLMAVVTDAGSVAVAWSDMSLQPVFATPNFFDGTPDHRMALRGKTIDAVIRLGGSFQSGERIEDAILWAVRKRGGLPPLPPAPRSLDAQLQFCLTSLTQSVVSPAPGKWFHALVPDGPSLPKEPVYLGDCASTIYRLTGKIPEGGPLVRGGAHIANDAVYFLTGKAQQWLDERRAQTRGIIEHQQRPDGSFRYGGQFRDGHFEDTSSGQCALPAANLLAFARCTGDRRALEAGVKTLEYMKRFRTPRGAQVWECPLHAPDIMASAHLVRAYVRGFELTGRTEYRDRAVRWALSGVPFVYQWSNRPVMLYATTPTLCATHYRGTVWVGLPVQWCGLVYADALLDLAAHDKTLDWRQLAEGILVAGEQMQYRDGRSVGALPDSWNLKAQAPAPYDINPCALVSLRLRLAGRLDSLSIVTEGRHRVIAPFPAKLKDGQPQIDAPAGARYQFILDGESHGSSAFALE